MTGNAPGPSRRHSSVRRWAVGACLLTLTLTGCGQPASEPAAPTGSTTPQATPSGSAIPPNAPTAATVSKLLVFIAENHSLKQMQSQMPYAFGLAKEYGYASDFTAIRHPSLPNYIAIAGGKTYGIDNDRDPSDNPVPGQSVFGIAIAAGKTAAVYAEGMPGNCATGAGGEHYAVKHNPWAYFTAERALCKRYDVGLDKFDRAIADGTLPNAGMVIPNLRNDAHDGTLGMADAWFERQMRKIFAGPDWQSGRLAVVLTADEDDHHAGNRVLTVLIHQSQHGTVARSPLTHYSLSRLYAEVTHTPALFAARTAPSMATAFGLPVG